MRLTRPATVRYRHRQTVGVNMTRTKEFPTLEHAEEWLAEQPDFDAEIVLGNLYWYQGDHQHNFVRDPESVDHTGKCECGLRVGESSQYVQYAKRQLEKVTSEVVSVKFINWPDNETTWNGTHWLNISRDQFNRIAKIVREPK